MAKWEPVNRGHLLAAETSAGGNRVEDLGLGILVFDGGLFGGHAGMSRNQR